MHDSQRVKAAEPSVSLTVTVSCSFTVQRAARWTTGFIPTGNRAFIGCLFNAARSDDVDDCVRSVHPGLLKRVKRPALVLSSCGLHLCDNSPVCCITSHHMPHLTWSKISLTKCDLKSHVSCSFEKGNSLNQPKTVCWSWLFNVSALLTKLVFTSLAWSC